MITGYVRKGSTFIEVLILWDQNGWKRSVNDSAYNLRIYRVMEKNRIFK